MDRQGCKGMSLNDGRIFSNIFNLFSTIEGSILQRVDAPTAKALDPILVLTFGIKRKSKLNDRSSTGFLTGLSKECRYDGCL